MISVFFPEVGYSQDTCDEYIIRPNHFHAIIKNIGVDPVGADLCVCPDDYQGRPTSEKTIPEKRVTGEHTVRPYTV